MVSFAITYQSGVSLQKIIGFELAAKIWSQYITDDVQFNLHVAETNEIPDNIIGGAVPIFDRVGYEDFKAALNEDQLSDSDRQALSHLAEIEGNEAAYSAFIDNTALTGDRITLSTANAKALGLLDEGNAPSLDGYIVINDLRQSEYSWSYDFARTEQIGSKSLDFLSVALHEIGHALGFVSGIDSQEISEDPSNLTEQLENLSALDLFRYSDRSLAENSLEFTKGQSSFFSIDGGTTRLAEFTSGVVENGDLVEGYQASHWNNLIEVPQSQPVDSNSREVQLSQVNEDIATLLQSANPATPEDEVKDASELLLWRELSNLLDQAQVSTVTGIGERGQSSLGVMDPTLAPGEQSVITELDLTALDVLGFDRTFQEVNLNYANLLTEVEASLAERLDLSLADLKQQGDEAGSLLTEDRYTEVASTIELNKILARRRRRVSRRYNSFWQENVEIDPTRVAIISDGAGEVSEINASLENETVTQVEALPHNALTFRSVNLQGDERDDLIVPRFDEVQEIDAGEGNNIIQIGRFGGNISVGSENDVVIVNGGDANILDLGGNNFFDLKDTDGGSQSNQTLTSGDGADQILFGGDSVEINSGAGNDVIIGDGFQNQLPYQDWNLDSAGGDNQLILKGQQHSRITATTGNGTDSIDIAGRYLTVDSGGGDDQIQATIVETTSGTVVEHQHSFRAAQGNNAIHIQSNNLFDSALVTTGDGADQIVTNISTVIVNSGDGNDIIQGSSTRRGYGEFTVSSSGGNNQVQFLGTGPDTINISTGSGSDEIDVIGGRYANIDIQAGGGLNVITAKGGNNSDLNIEAGQGNDKISFRGDSATVNAGAGNDIIQGEGLGNFKDFSITAESGDNQIRFLGVNRDYVSIRTGNGQDKVFVNHSEYDINTADGNDIVHIEFGTGNIFGGGGNDVLISKGGDFITLNGNDGEDLLAGGLGRESLQGGAMMDTLIGGRSNDSLDGGDGNDILIGSNLSGNTETEIDTLNGGSGDDIYILGNKSTRFYSTHRWDDHAQITMTRGDKIQLHGQASDYEIQANRLLYNGDLIARFIDSTPTNLDSDQFIYVGPNSEVQDHADIDLSSFDLSLEDIDETGTSVASAINESNWFETELASIETFNADLKETLQTIDFREDITYSIVGGANNELFNINTISGELTFKRDNASLAAIAADEDQLFEVQVQATQGNGTRARDVDTQTLRINLDGGIELPLTGQIDGGLPLEPSPSLELDEPTEQASEQNRVAINNINTVPLGTDTDDDAVNSGTEGIERVIHGEGQLEIPLETNEPAEQIALKETSAITGTEQNDILYGTHLHDRIDGAEGNDKLLGRSKADTLLGGLGNDTLSGGLGADWLEGTTNHNSNTKEVDRLSGGAGADTFVLGDETGAFYINRNDGDRAIIEDFELSKDILLLYGSASDYSIREVGQNSRISYGDDLVALVKNTVNLDLTQSNFLFVE